MTPEDVKAWADVAVYAGAAAASVVGAVIAVLVKVWPLLTELRAGKSNEAVFDSVTRAMKIAATEMRTYLRALHDAQGGGLVRLTEEEQAEVNAKVLACGKAALRSQGTWDAAVRLYGSEQAVSSQLLEMARTWS